MRNSFSIKNRGEYFHRLGSQNFDILIIGGGITGAGIALDAASRGFKVALIEKSDFASGTSSRSTKLVHGGLRYLEHLEFRVVSQVGKERETVYNNAPHIVIPEKMLLPIIKDGKLGMFTSSLALQLYDYLAGVKKSEKRKMLNVAQTLKIEPLLLSNELIGGALYYEYKTDDSRLVIETLKKAADFGVTAINYVEAKEFLYSNKQVSGVIAEDKLSGLTLNISAKNVVNATGVWTDNLRKLDGSLYGKRLHLTRGIHIVVSRKDFNLQHAIYFDVGDGRMVFAIPRFKTVYIGTTDTNFHGDPDYPGVPQEDVDYLVAAINKICPNANLKKEHIESVWSGLRPLIHEDGKDPSELSRKDEIFISPSGLMSIAGGKLTGYRLMAKKIVNKIVNNLPEGKKEKYPKCQTKNIKLSGGEFEFTPNSKQMKRELSLRFEANRNLNITKDEFKRLFFRYGSNIDAILQKVRQYRLIGTKNPLLRAEVAYSVENEMTINLSDFLIRRTGGIHFFIHEIEQDLGVIAEEMATLLGWTKEEKGQQLANFRIELDRAKMKN